MRKYYLMICCLFILPAAYAADTPSTDAQNRITPIDSIVAVVNGDVITRYELEEKLAEVVHQLKKQGTPLPASKTLEKQILERMISDLLQAQFARDAGVRVDDAQLDLALNRIAQQNNFADLASFRAKLESEGVDYKQFREEVRTEIVSTRLREREIDSKVQISDAEVDNYLANKAKLGGAQEEYHLAHILVVVPEQASAEKIQSSRLRAEQALSQLQGGAEFAQLAAGLSDAKDALSGGDLGWRAGERIPPLFLEALQKLKPGEITPILRSPSGFHIVKLLEKRSGNAPVVVTQTHVRHILIKTNEITSDAEAKRRILEVQQNIEAGANFADQAKRYSEDASAQKGGDLDWISPGQTVPEFEDAMNKLQPDEIAVVSSQFGWHLIQVLARRSTDVSVQQQRQQARIAIGIVKSDELYEDWLRQLRDRAFVEYHTEAKPRL
jgi:peptidyl-prolyl cis-trans isomerase SurA